jgi:hypothetical protein
LRRASALCAGKADNNIYSWIFLIADKNKTKATATVSQKVTTTTTQTENQSP